MAIFTREIGLVSLTFLNGGCVGANESICHDKWILSDQELFFYKGDSAVLLKEDRLSIEVGGYGDGTLPASVEKNISLKN